MSGGFADMGFFDGDGWGWKNRGILVHFFLLRFEPVLVDGNGFWKTAFLQFSFENQGFLGFLIRVFVGNYLFERGEECCRLCDAGFPFRGGC